MQPHCSVKRAGGKTEPRPMERFGVNPPAEFQLS